MVDDTDELDGTEGMVETVGRAVLVGVDRVGVGLGAGGRGLVRVRVVRGFRDGQFPRCFCAIHSGAPRLIASSGQVNWYIEMSLTARQRPPRNSTQNGSPECSLAITAHPSSQLMTRAPASGYPRSALIERASQLAAVRRAVVDGVEDVRDEVDVPLRSLSGKSTGVAVSEVMGPQAPPSPE